MSRDAGPAPAYDIEDAVRQRYAAGAAAVEPALCCPTEYDPAYLKLIPQEILDKDYGCGDPSQFVGPGETVVDLGSGGGKICYILAQKVGASGAVIGVDFNDTMLALAGKYRAEMVRKLGYANVKFLKGRIQDLALDLSKAETWLKQHPVTTLEQHSQFEAYCQTLRLKEPLIAGNSIDVIVSNCVLNLVRPEEKQKLFAEMFRVLKRGGRAVISDIVCDEEPTPAIMNDAELWSGCISGAFREDRFLEMFEEAGFYGIEILSRASEPWQTIDGVEFRSMTVRAYKGKQGPCLERNQAVIYRGPFRQVHDDDGHIFVRGQRTAVCDKTFAIMTDVNGPYQRHVVGVEPLVQVPIERAAPFNCHSNRVRHPSQTKGQDYRRTIRSDHGPCCDTDGCC